MGVRGGEHSSWKDHKDNRVAAGQTGQHLGMTKGLVH